MGLSQRPLKKGVCSIGVPSNHSKMDGSSFGDICFAFNLIECQLQFESAAPLAAASERNSKSQVQPGLFAVDRFPRFGQSTWLTSCCCFLGGGGSDFPFESISVEGGSA